MSTKPTTTNPWEQRRQATRVLEEAHKADPTFSGMPFAKWVDDIAIGRPALADHAHTWLAHREIDALRARQTDTQREANRDQALLAIAKEHLDIHTFETRRSDSLDFHEVSVWGAHAALKAAYEAGRASR